MLFPRSKGNLFEENSSFFLILGITKQDFFTQKPPLGKSQPRSLFACTKNYWTKRFLHVAASKKFPSGFASFTWCKRFVWDRLLGYSCPNEFWLVFGMPKWTLASRKGSLKWEASASATCIPQGENRLEKPKINTKENPSINEKDGMESILRTKAPKKRWDGKHSQNESSEGRRSRVAVKKYGLRGNQPMYQYWLRRKNASRAAQTTRCAGLCLLHLVLGIWQQGLAGPDQSQWNVHPRWASALQPVQLSPGNRRQTNLALRQQVQRLGEVSDQGVGCVGPGGKKGHVPCRPRTPQSSCHDNFLDLVRHRKRSQINLLERHAGWSARSAAIVARHSLRLIWPQRKAAVLFFAAASQHAAKKAFILSIAILVVKLHVNWSRSHLFWFREEPQHDLAVKQALCVNSHRIWGSQSRRRGQMHSQLTVYRAVKGQGWQLPQRAGDGRSGLPNPGGDAFTHRRLIHTDAFTHRRFYTQALIQTNTHFHTQELLAQDLYLTL